MPKVYFPISYIDVPASEPHPGNMYYRVSKGIEHRGAEEPRYVYKIQMVCSGVVDGLASPSYPEGGEDFKKVIDAMRTLQDGGGRNGRGMMTAAGDQPGMPLHEVQHILKMHPA
ncbi:MULTISPECIES: hypothetical protein [Rhizobium]|uniref:hypothetical protein n=1 Tax=Rhizobium lusitanum TaxID=293958 RepID=UPI001954D6C5|nr:hypothetical protein [Rhizobium lusitanum]